MTIEQERLTPKQEDREAAADLVIADGSQYHRAHCIRAGSHDEGPLVQAFMNHRLAALKPPPIGGEAFQARVQPWLMACFGAGIAADREERNHRFLEESLELVQSCGCTASEAHQLVDYVYGRDIGEPAQEVGGVMVTLAALCLANGLDMHANGETELARVWTKVEAIRAKQAAKPKHSPLPIQPTTSGDVGKLCEELHGPVQWGYMCLADGGFIADNAPVEAAARISALEKALEPFARAARSLSAEAPDGIDDGLTITASIHCKPEREAILSTADFSTARALLNPTPTEER